MGERRVVIPRFQVLRRGEVIRVVPVHRNRLVVGSEDGAHLRLKHPAIAPRHLEVSVVSGRYLEAANLAGEGRVLLGNQPMNRARLREGDELDLGPVTLRLTYERSGSRPRARSERPDDEPTVEEKAPAEEPTIADEPTEAIVRPLPRSDPREDEATVAAPSPAFSDRPGSERIPIPPPRPAPVPPAAAETGSLDLDLDEVVLDPTPVVTIEPPGGRAQRVPLRIGSFVVGAGRCAFRLSYPGVAPAHAEMMVMPDGAVYLKHLAGSGLLTLRNGAPVQFSRWRSGDRLQIGPVSMRLELVPRASAVSTIPTRVGRSTALSKEPAPPRAPVVASPPTLPPPAAEAPSSPALRAVPPELVPPLAPRTAPAALVPPLPAPRAVPAVPAPLPRPPAPPESRPPALAPVIPPTPVPPTPVRPPPVPPPPARSLVRVRRKKKAHELQKSLSPLVTTNTVEVSLDVSSRDTFRSIVLDDDILYQRPLAQRLLTPVAIVVLLLIVAWQAALQIGAFDIEDPTLVPRTAVGSSGVTTGADGLVRPSDGPVTVGDPTAVLQARRARAGGDGSYDYGGPGNIDWEDRSRGTSVGGRSYSTEHSLPDFRARAAEEIEGSARRPAETSAPSEQPSAGQGFVDMEVVEKVIYDGGRNLRHCYTKAREADRRLEGTLWLTLTLGLDGRIRGVVTELRSSLKSESLRECMARRLYALSMPTPQGGPVTFSYSFEFRPSE